MVEGQPDDGGLSGEPEITPLVVNGIMYLTARDRVVALDPETGHEIWSHVMEKGHVAELKAELLGWLLFAFPNRTAVDHDVMFVGDAVDADRTKGKRLKPHAHLFS